METLWTGESSEKSPRISEGEDSGICDTPSEISEGVPHLPSLSEQSEDGPQLSSQIHGRTRLDKHSELSLFIIYRCEGVMLSH